MMLKLYSSEGCPFAHRTRAVLTHLDVPFELHEIDLDNRSAELLRLSPTGKVPLLVDDDFTLYESQVINDYLADSLGWEEALTGNARQRARQRLAMKQWDAVVAPAFYRSMRQGGEIDATARDRVGRELDELAKTVADLDGQGDSMLAFHVAPHWVRMDWLRAVTPIAAMVDERPGLRRWLDEAVALAAVQAAVPERDATVARYQKRYVGQA